MLKNIPRVLSPELLKILSEMGHGDELVIGDGNYPAASTARNLVRCDATDVSTLLDAVLAVFPLDEYVDKPVAVMQYAADYGEPPVWKVFRDLVVKHDKAEFTNFELMERFAFYERAKAAYAILATHEKALYANIILKKGVIR